MLKIKCGRMFTNLAIIRRYYIDIVMKKNRR